MGFLFSCPDARRFRFIVISHLDPTVTDRSDVGRPFSPSPSADKTAACSNDGWVDFPSPRVSRVPVCPFCLQNASLFSCAPHLHATVDQSFSLRKVAKRPYRFKLLIDYRFPRNIKSLCQTFRSNDWIPAFRDRYSCDLTRARSRYPFRMPIECVNFRMFNILSYLTWSSV